MNQLLLIFLLCIVISTLADFKYFPHQGEIHIEAETYVPTLSPTFRPTLSPTIIPPNIPSNEYFALKAIYTATNGSTWSWISDGTKPWNFQDSTINPCLDNWTGISCIFLTNSSHISQLKLGLHNMHGTIPQQIGQFPYLGLLDFSFNRYLVGGVPGAIGNLKNLQVLKLNGDRLRGSLPDEFYSLPNLLFLNLSSNGIRGNLSTYIANFTHLQVLDLSINRFHGTLPEGLYALTSLVFLTLNANLFHGTISSSIGNFSNILALRMSLNVLTGSIPTSIYRLSNLLDLEIAFNYLNGTIGAEIKQLTSIEMISLNFNDLHGTLPSTLYSLRELRFINLINNHLSGSIPSSISQLHNLQVFSITANNFTGTVPSSMVQLQNLTVLWLGSNHFHGSLPDFLPQLPQLRLLMLAVNQFNGTIPSSYQYFHNLVYFNIAFNQLEGPILPYFANSTTIRFFIITTNRLTGRLPTHFTRNMTSVHAFNVANNLFTGTIPTTYYNFTNIAAFYINGNLFHGSLPLFHWPYLSSFNVQNNSLTGTVPVSLYACHHLNSVLLSDNQFEGNLTSNFYNTLLAILYFDAGNNGFTGTVPLLYNIRNHTFVNHLNENISNYIVQNNYFTGTLPINMILSQETAGYFDFSENYFHGSVPNLIRASQFYASNNLFSGSLPYVPEIVTTLTQLYLDQNYLTSSIPVSLTNYTNLVELDLEQNELTGTISIALFLKFQNLEILFLESNSLTGTLPELPEDQIVHSSIANIDISHNSITGTIPTSMFRLPKLNSFAAISNCMHGYLPEEICLATNLTSLALDGISTSEICRLNIFKYLNFQGFRHAFLLEHHLSGSIPTCIFAMPYLQSLHLSGNKLTGTIPDDVTIDPSLIDLSLSHNHISGTIPDNIQNHLWLNLDLSNNKIRGRINSNGFANFSKISASYLSLQVNRLSGRLPSSLVNVKNISVLAGNIFACKPDRTDLPKHDSVFHSYTCGSDLMTIALAIWLGMLLFPLAISLLFIRKRVSRTVEYFWKMIKDTSEAIGKLCRRESTTTRTTSVTNVGLSLHVRNSNPHDDDDGMSIANDSIAQSSPSMASSRDPSKSLYHSNRDISQSINGSLTSASQRKQKKNASPATHLTFMEHLSLIVKQLRRFRKALLDTNKDNMLSSAALQAAVQPIQRAFSASANRLTNTFHATLTIEMNPIYQLVYFNYVIRQLFVLLMIILILVYLPVYGVITVLNQSYYAEYIWTVSPLLLTGIESGIVLCVMFIVFAIIAIIFFQYFLLHTCHRLYLVVAIWIQEKPNWRLVLGDILVFIINFGVMLIIDIVYVYLYITYDEYIIILTELFLAVFKLYWNEYVLWDILRSVKAFAIAAELKEQQEKQQNGDRTSSMRFTDSLRLSMNDKKLIAESMQEERKSIKLLHRSFNGSKPTAGHVSAANSLLAAAKQDTEGNGLTLEEDIISKANRQDRSLSSKLSSKNVPQNGDVDVEEEDDDFDEDYFQDENPLYNTGRSASFSIMNIRSSAVRVSEMVNTNLFSFFSPENTPVLEMRNSLQQSSNRKTFGGGRRSSLSISQINRSSFLTKEVGSLTMSGKLNQPNSNEQNEEAKKLGTEKEARSAVDIETAPSASPEQGRQSQQENVPLSANQQALLSNSKLIVNAQDDLKIPTTRETILLTVYIILNTLFIPCLAIAAVDPNCFYYALIAASSIRASYGYTNCDRSVNLLTGLTATTCLNSATSVQSIDYDPPFIYSYQCSSYLAINYIPVHIFVIILSGTIRPLMKVVMKVLYENTSPTSIYFPYISAVTPAYFKRPQATPPDSYEPLFGKFKYVLFIQTSLMMILVFGILFPPLAVIATVSVVNVSFFEEFAVGRILYMAKKRGYGWYQQQIEKECEQMADTFPYTIWMTLLACCTMCSYVVFDTVADETGTITGMIPAMVVTVFPGFLLLVYNIYQYWEGTFNPDVFDDQSMAEDEFRESMMGSMIRQSIVQLACLEEMDEEDEEEEKDSNTDKKEKQKSIPDNIKEEVMETVSHEGNTEQVMNPIIK